MMPRFSNLLLGIHPYNTVFNYNWVNIRPMIKTFQSLKEHFGGRLIDLGAGGSPYYNEIAQRNGLYIAVDFLSALPPKESRNILRVAGDTLSVPILSESVDAVFCSQVLSQVAEPERALREIARILRPGGSAVISVPSISPIHSEPRDYFRFTPDGLEFLLKKVGLGTKSIHIQGQLFSSFALCFAMNLVLSRIKPGEKMRLQPAYQILFAPLIAIVNLLAKLLDWIFPFNRTPVNFILVALKTREE